MAEIVGLIASIAGVSTAGIQIATLLCSSIRFVKGLEDEIKNVAREVETLSSVFEEISTTLQLGNEESSSSTTKFNISRRAILTISDLVQDSQSLYEKIGDAVSHQSKLKGVNICLPKFQHDVVTLSNFGLSASQMDISAGRSGDMECKAV
jgi:hypothetical protein